MDRIHNDIERSIIEDIDYDGMGDFSRFGNQGRTRKQYEDSAKLVAYSLLGLMGLLIVMMIVV